MTTATDTSAITGRPPSGDDVREMAAALDEVARDLAAPAPRVVLATISAQLRELAPLHDAVPVHTAAESAKEFA